MATNRDHYHLWLETPSGRAMFKKGGPGFHTRQACAQWGKRHLADREHMVRRCDKERCKPRLD